MINKSKLTKEEMKDFLAKVEDNDKKLDHSRAYRTLMNEARRELLKFIGCEIRSMDEIKKEFKLDEDQIRYHLSMLMQSLYVIESHERWKSTPRGIGFLENAIMED
jgi:predicted transcriptional regulator